MSTHDARGPVISRQLADREWRVGGSVGRTIYAVEGRHDPCDFLIGIMDSAELAHLAVDDHNAMHAARQGIHAYGPVPELNDGQDPGRGGAGESAYSLKQAGDPPAPPGAQRDGRADA